MAGIHGITVTLFDCTVTGRDSFGADIYTETAETVDDVIVYPASAEDVIRSTELYGKRAVYNLCIPKGDTHIWEDRKVSFLGKTFRAFGPEKEYIEDMLPLRWNKQVMVEKYE